MFIRGTTDKITNWQLHYRKWDTWKQTNTIYLKKITKVNLSMNSNKTDFGSEMDSDTQW